MIEVTIRISNDEQNYNQKFLLHHEGLSLSKEDPELLRMVNETLANFKGHVEDVLVKIKFTW